MHLSPWILLRVAGLPFSYLENLRWTPKALQDYFNYNEQLAQDRSQLLSFLTKAINELEDYPAQFYVNILRKQIQAQKPAKLKSFTFQGTQESLFEQTIFAVQAYNQKLHHLKKLENNISESYAQEIIASRTYLQSIANHQVFRKGLQLSSQSLLNRLESFQRNDPARFNKKQRQTSLTLLQYLGRVCAKTSPFSHFTPVSFWDLSQRLQAKAHSIVRLNNQLHRFLLESLEHYRPFYLLLPLRWNDTAILNEHQWTYLLNTRNVESIQRMDDSPVIQMIKSLLDEATEPCSLTSLRGQLGQAVEAAPMQIEDYIRNLVSYGLLSWGWTIAALDPRWPQLWIEQLSRCQDPLLSKIKSTLEALIVDAEQFANGTEEERSYVLNNAYGRIGKLVAAMATEIDLPEQDLKQVITLQKISLGKFNVPKEQLFYEDVSTTAPTMCSAAELQELSEAFSSLLRVLKQSNVTKVRRRHEQFFAQHFSGQAIPLLSYYEAYHQLQKREKAEPTATDTPSGNALATATTLASFKQEWIAEDHLQLSLAAENTSFEPSPRSTPSTGILTQVYREDGKLRAYLDTTLFGFGKLWGRFLPLFPDELTESLRLRNAQLAKPKEIYCENTDASIYNPNMHPPLLRYEISIPGGQQLQEHKQQIQIGDLLIQQNSGKDKLELLHSPSRQLVRVFDFGFEAIENRSPLYQLLQVFSVSVASPAPLLRALQASTVRKQENGLLLQPRISFGQAIVLQRKAWIFPVHLLPQALKGKSDFDNFLLAQEWCRSHGLPKQFFLQPVGEAQPRGKEKGDHYKPQYMEVQSPLFVQLLFKTLAKVKGPVKIEEVLPKVSGAERVTECLLELDRRRVKYSPESLDDPGE